MSLVSLGIRRNTKRKPQWLVIIDLVHLPGRKTALGRRHSTIHQNAPKKKLWFLVAHLGQISTQVYNSSSVPLSSFFLVFPRSCQLFGAGVIVKDGHDTRGLSKILELGYWLRIVPILMYGYYSSVYCGYVANHFCGDIIVYSPTLASGSESLWFSSVVV